MKDTTAILSIAYPEVEKNIKANLNKYKNYLSRFINSRSEQFYSNMPTKQIYFTQDDYNDFFKSTNINKDIINNAISKTYYADIANFNPRYAKDDCTVAMLCLVRYFKLKNMKKELDLALINLAFSGKYYPSIFYGSFQVALPQEHIMEYVINHMCTNKFDIVREGTVIGAVKSICETWLKTYESRFKEFHDDDVVYLIQQLHNRIKSFIINLAKLYYQAYENKDYITYDSDDVSEDNYHLADSDSFKIQRSVESTMNYMNTHGIDYRLCKMSSNNLIKNEELKSIIENILADNNNMLMVRELITLMIVCYFTYGDNKIKIKDVRDLEFISYSIKAKPNSKDQYIVKQKEIVDKLLINNSEHFNRRKNRKETYNAYVRSINSYFSLLIQEANK